MKIYASPKTLKEKKKMTDEQNAARCVALVDCLKTLLGSQGCRFAFDDTYVNAAKAMLHKIDLAAAVALVAAQGECKPIAWPPQHEHVWKPCPELHGEICECGWVQQK